MTTKIYVSTVDYFNAHWHQPKGRGRWVFQLRTRTKSGFIDQQHLFMGTYTECLKGAKRVARDTGATIIYVLP